MVHSDTNDRLSLLADALERTEKDMQQSRALKDRFGRMSVMGVACELSGVGEWEFMLPRYRTLTEMDPDRGPTKYFNYAIKDGDTIVEDGEFCPNKVIEWYGIDIDRQCHYYSRAMQEYTDLVDAEYGWTLSYASHSGVAWSRIADWIREAARNVGGNYAKG